MTKKIYLGAATLIGLSIVFGAIAFQQHLVQLRQQAESAFLSRNELVTKYVAMHRDQITVMHELFLRRYQALRHHPTRPEAHQPQRRGAFWESGMTSANGAGIFSGDSALPLSSQQSSEMSSAMAMDAQIKAALQFDSDVAWMYYLSAQRFIYLAPPAPTQEFHFTQDLYQRGYWLESGIANNAERRMILVGPYQDKAGQGWIMTLARPVFDGEDFLGVVALDLRVNTLNKLTVVGNSIGETFMVSEKDHLIASASGDNPGSHMHPPESNKLIDWLEDDSRDLWLSSPVVKDELWLVHRVKQADLYLAAARETAFTWIVLLLLNGLFFFAWRLRVTLAEVTRITMVDPLTKALNRRGLYEKAAATLALGTRKKLSVAVLIMDIDHFKKINDNHGHAVGDSVLQQLGGYVLGARRPFDVVCRWGGEEFVFVFLVDAATQAFAVAERMRQEAHRTRIQPGDLQITLSGGLVLLQKDETLDQAIARADTLLYEAKTHGRNHIAAQSGLKP